MLNGQCSATPEECEDLNSQSGFGVATAKPFQQRCLANGCILAMTPGTGTCTSVAGADGNICNGEYRFTGAVCGATPPPVHIVGPDTVEAAAKNDPQACTSAGGGSHDYCVKRSGEHCMTSAQGRQLCWKPGETGTKTDGPVAQVRNAGTDVVPPALNLPSGDTLQPTGQKTTATSGSTITTTTNYTTIHGTNAGPKDQGQPADGTGSEESEEGSASGGADCQQRPVVSDPMLEMVATQAWATRCAVEAGNTAKVTGDVGDCSLPFSVEGDNANAVKLRAMRADICGDNQPEWTKGDAPATPGAGDEGDIEDATKFGIGVGPGLLDESDIFGGGTCPQFSFQIAGTSISSNDYPQWCNVVAIMRALILIFGAYTALRILMGGE